MDNKSDILTDIYSSFDLSKLDDLVKFYIAIRLSILGMKAVRRCIENETQLDLSM